MTQSLFARTAFILAFVFLLFQSLSSFVVYRAFVKPVAERSADDLAGLIVLSAQTWVELPPEVRPAFEQELAKRHGIRLQPVSSIKPVQAKHFPFKKQIEQALSTRLGKGIQLNGRADGAAVWVEVPVGGKLLQAGFFPDRYAVKPPLATVTLVSVGTFIVLLTALLLVRRITVPLARASRAASVVGKGGIPDTLPETGPKELADLARRFNQMAREVHDLLENRTTLLGGISHDLRTPLTRIQLHLELLRGSVAPDRLARIEKDLAEMNGLIGGYLELARNTRLELPQSIDLDALVGSVAAKYGANYASIGNCPFLAGAKSLGRILDNLLQNAIRYGGDTAPEIHLKCGRAEVEISVLDSGPGIPDAELEKVTRPFYRLEASRASSTGGTGLGLAIVKQLTELNGWKLRLENRAGGGLAASVILR